MANFPRLQPAFTIQVKIDPPTAVDSASRNKLMVVPMTSGTVKSEADSPLAFNGEFTGTGNDYIRMDPDGKRMRLDAHGVIQTVDGSSVYLNYTGIVEMTPELAGILSDESESVTTPFGKSFIHVTFQSLVGGKIQTGDAKYAELENRVWVGAGHFIYEKGQQPIVEYKVSKVGV
ncbi:hypothetical protein AJ80_03179 [Polytolypa hystricis UAMH7299]|uniref:Uncharacterized protein n=1 Tax=Polytolypa hystricis (strain UAMH7299) TaxID=1447883 RepID=A0A2B7YKC5_POLH7|nr:hypothetical protein AJ80_03179 [Polytolypa hystricis UAMH7299]